VPNIQGGESQLLSVRALNCHRKHF